MATPSFQLSRLENVRSHFWYLISSPSAVSVVYLQNVSQVWWSFWHHSGQVLVISYLEYFNSLLTGSPNITRSRHSAHKSVRVKTQVLIIICKANMVRHPVMNTLTPLLITLDLAHSFLDILTHWHSLKIFTMLLPQSLHLPFHLSRMFLPQIPHGSSFYQILLSQEGLFWQSFLKI